MPDVANLPLFLLALVTDSLYALLAGTAGQWLKGRRFLHTQRYVVGSVYLGLGATAALADTRKP
jgi:threonine/homoserine/homoserine lactone efflux protein